MTPRLTLLLISLWLGHAAAQNAPAAKPAPSTTAPAAPAAPASPATPTSAAPATAAAPAAPKADTANEPTPPSRLSKKGKADEAPPPPPKPAGPLKPPACTVAQFRAIGMDTTDEKARRDKAGAWLKKYAPNCSAEQLIVIRNNRSQWLGSADSAALAAMVDGLLESFAETNKDVAILLYGTPPAPPKPKPDDGTNKTGTNADAAKK